MFLLDFYARVWLDNLKERGYSDDLDVDGKIILEWILGKQGGKIWTGLIWVMIGISGGLLWTR